MSVSSEEEFLGRGRTYHIAIVIAESITFIGGIEISRDPNLSKANKKVNFNLGQLAEKSRD